MSKKRSDAGDDFFLAQTVDRCDPSVTVTSPLDVISILGRFLFTLHQQWMIFMCVINMGEVKHLQWSSLFMQISFWFEKYII